MFACSRGVAIDPLDKVYASIGEFVVAFQWAENKYRETGWFILDPERKDWPPRALRKETNSELINKVTNLYSDLVDKYDLPSSLERRADMLRLQAVFHQLRKFRNTLLHAAFIELKAGGDVTGMLRSDPKSMVDTETGEIQDVELVTEAKIAVSMEVLSRASRDLGQHYIQLVHWAPFTRFKLRPRS